MLLKLTCIINDFDLEASGPLSIAIDNSRPITLTLEKALDEKNAINKTYCITTVTCTPSGKNLEIFSKISKGEIDIPSSGISSTYENKEGEKVRVPSLDGFPNHYQDFINQIKNELFTTSKQFVSTIKWRLHIDGTNEHLVVRKMEWSEDAIFWNPTSCWIGVAILQPNYLPPIDSKTINYLLELTSKIKGEPIHHELFREAWSLKGAYKRSALIIGISAAEVSVKQCISQLIPHAKWLTENTPSPPIVKMIEEFLPTIPVRCLCNNKVLPVSKTTVNNIKKGVQIRNTLIHTGGESLSIKNNTIEEILLSIKDLLWLIDFYCGHDWAISYIRDGTLNEMCKKIEN